MRRERARRSCRLQTSPQHVGTARLPENSSRGLHTDDYIHFCAAPITKAAQAFWQAAVKEPEIKGDPPHTTTGKCGTNLQTFSYISITTILMPWKHSSFVNVTGENPRGTQQLPMFSPEIATSTRKENATLRHTEEISQLSAPLFLQKTMSAFGTINTSGRSSGKKNCYLPKNHQFQTLCWKVR